jgi:hypothetical protein
MEETHGNTVAKMSGCSWTDDGTHHPSLRCWFTYVCARVSCRVMSCVSLCVVCVMNHY